MHKRLSLILAAALLFDVAPAQSDTAQNAIPRFERADCDYPIPLGIARDVHRECGYLVVAENRGRPAGRTYRLAVVTYRAKTPDNQAPLLLLHGGPGGVGGTHFPWGNTVQSPLARGQDVVIFDMRGVGASEPRLCPNFETAAAFVKPTRREWEADYRTAVRACVAQLDSIGIDRTAFGADVNAMDAVDLRRTLGYARWDIYGVSYGSLVVQELLRIDSPATRAAALVSGIALGPMHSGELALAHQNTLHNIFAQCAAQPACQRAFPALQADFQALYDELMAKPLELAVPNGAQPRMVLLNGERFITEMRQGLAQPAIVRRIPLLVHELRHGDRTAALRYMIGTGVISAWDALTHLVGCNQSGASYRATVAATLPSLHPPYRAVADDVRDHCDLWLPQPTRQSDTRPVVSDVPTLVVHGEFEVADVKRTQQLMTAGLKRAYAYTFSGLGHAGQTVGCYGAVIERFLQNPTRAPDSSCIGAMQGIQFKTTPGFAATATFVIGGATAGRFAGAWETHLAGGQDFSVQLESDGDGLRGFLSDPTHPIFDGRMDGSAIHFKVKTADSARVVSFTGTLRNDQLEFDRSATLLAPREPATQGFLGTLGPGTLIAKRVPGR